MSCCMRAHRGVTQHSVVCCCVQAALLVWQPHPGVGVGRIAVWTTMQHKRSRAQAADQTHGVRALPHHPTNPARRCGRACKACIAAAGSVTDAVLLSTILHHI